MNRKILTIERIDLSDYTTLVNLESYPKLKELQDKDDWLLETSEAFYLLKQGVAFRYVKPHAKPTLLKTLKFEASPDFFSSRCELEAADLLAFALKNRIPLFETNSEYILPGDPFLYAKKRV